MVTSGLPIYTPFLYGFFNYYMKNIKKYIKRITSVIRHIHAYKVDIFILGVFIFEMIFPQVTLAQQFEDKSYLNPTIIVEDVLRRDPMSEGAGATVDLFINSLPV